MAWKLLQIGVVALWTYLLVEGAVTSTGQLPPFEMIMVGGIGLGVGMAAIVTGVVYWTLEGWRALTKKRRASPEDLHTGMAKPSRAPEAQGSAASGHMSLALISRPDHLTPSRSWLKRHSR
jgi:hypothetical protein